MAFLMAFNGKISIMFIDTNSFGRVLEKHEDLNGLSGAKCLWQNMVLNGPAWPL